MCLIIGQFSGRRVTIALQTDININNIYGIIILLDRFVVSVLLLSILNKEMEKKRTINMFL